MKNSLYQTFRVAAALLIAGAFLMSFVLHGRSLGAADKQTSAPSSKAKKSNIYFEANRGQIDEQAKFISRGAGGYTLFLAASEAVYVLPMAEDNQQRRVESRESEIEDRIQNSKSKSENSKAFALRMQFVGANPAAQISGADELATKANYFKGNDSSGWLTDVPTFSRVRYREVYPDIDLEFYGNAENKSEYDFIVAPNADASIIELDFTGANQVEIDQTTGELLIHTVAGTIKQTKPFSYQESNNSKREIESGYEKSGATSVRFRVGEYDRTRPLVIDPALGNLAFSTFLGGAGSDNGSDIKVDAAGNVYVAGVTNADLFPTTSGVYDTTFNGGGSDIFVTKMSADGSSLIYSTYLGGNDSDECFSVAVDATGSVFLAGDTRSVNFPTTPGAFDTAVTGGTFDVVVVKLNATGNQLIYSTFIGNSGYELGLDIAVDSTGNAFVTGYTNDSAFPTTAGAYDTSYNGGSFDVYVSKLNSSGTALIYSTLLGGDASDFSQGVAIDNVGNAVITGSTNGGTTVLPTTAGAYDTTFGGSIDAFVAKFNSAGNGLVFSTFLGGTSNDLGNAVALDQLGNVYVTGNTASADFSITFGAYDQTYGGSGNFDIFVTKISAAGGSLSYSTYISGNSTENGNDIVVDTFGAAYIVGSGGSDFPTTSNAFDPIGSGFVDAVVSKLNPAGSGLSYSTFLGGSSVDTANGIALDSANNVYVAGFTNSAGFPTTANAFQTEWAGANDAFVAKLGNFAITGKTVDVTGASVQSATIALSGLSSATTLTDASGRFVFLDALPNRAYTVSASKAGTVFNPSLFNISNLNDNRDLIFVAGGAPGGGSGSNLSFSANSFSTNESGGATIIRVWRDLQTINSTVTVNYATSDGTATVGPDYIAASGTLTFAPGVTERTFSVFVRDDLLTEGSESINLVLSNPTGGATLGTSAAVLNVDDNGEPQLQTAGYTLGIVSIPGSLRNRHLAGIAASPTDGTIYVATDNNYIEPPSSLTNNCGTQPVQTSFELLRIAPNNATTLVGTYSIPHRALVNLEFNPVDGMLYTVGTDRKIYRINPAGGALSVFNSDVGFDTERYGLEADAAGNLILMRYGSPNSFYRVSAGIGAMFLGSYADDAAANFGDRFGIQPDGDYVVYSDAPKTRNPREFEIDTTGHADGSPFNFSYLTGSNIRTLGSGYIHSNGAVNPINGDVFTAGGNCSAGSSVILRTSASGNSSSVSTTFINGIGNNYNDGADNFNARGVTDLDFGARRDGQTGNCLYFADDFNDVIYQACGFAPTAASVSVSGRVFAPGRGAAAIVSMTDANGNTRTAETDMLGYFRFEEVETGQTYIFETRSKRLRFATQIVTITENLDELNFTPKL